MGRLSKWVTAVVYGVDSVDALDERPSVRASAPLNLGTSQAGRLSSASWNADGFCVSRVSRDSAISVPTIKRARDLICGTVASLPFTFWRTTPVDLEDEQVEPATWAARPDPSRTRGHVLAWTVDDLIFEGAAFWRILDRTGADRPSAFRLMRACEVSVDQSGEFLRYRGEAIPSGDVVQFVSLLDGLLAAGARHIAIARKLDAAAERFADVEIPSGYLAYDGTGDVEVGQEQLNELADMWTSRRKTNATAALPPGLSFNESTSDPSRLQLTEARQHQALELSRAADVPPWLVGAPPGTGMTYQNAQQARLDVLDFGALPFIQCIEETLSGPNVAELGHYVKLDPSAWVDISTTALGIAGGEADASSPKALAELVQKIYLGVGSVLTSDEARSIVNDAGGTLFVPGPYQESADV